MAAKPMVLYESDDFIALASEEVAIRSVFPHEIDTFDPYEGEVRVWKAEARAGLRPSPRRRAQAYAKFRERNDPWLSVQCRWACTPKSCRARPSSASSRRARRRTSSIPTATTSTSTSAPSSTPGRCRPKEINLKLRELMSQGNGTIVMHNPGAKHGVAVGMLNRLNLHIEGSLGYFGCGLIDGPNINITGRVGWSCAENMLTRPRGHREERRLDLRCRDPRRRPGVQGRCRRARRHRPEGRHHPHRRPRRRVLRLHDAARPHGHPGRRRQEPRRFDV